MKNKPKFKETSVKEFLGLSDEEDLVIEQRLPNSPTQIGEFICAKHGEFNKAFYEAPPRLVKCQRCAKWSYNKEEGEFYGKLAVRVEEMPNWKKGGSLAK